MNDRHQARQATITAFNRKHAGSPDYQVEYTGLFPFKGVADSVPIAETGDLTDHQRQWGKLFSNFDKAWLAFRDAT